MARATSSRPGNPDGPGKTAPIVVWKDGAATQVEWLWGLRPHEQDGKPISLLRAEGRDIDQPCLIIANDFGLRIDGKIRYRAKLKTDAAFFCIAGVWNPATADWPAAFAALTVEAYPDMRPYKDRHVAVIRNEDWEVWLRGSTPASEVLRPFDEGSFEVIGANRPPVLHDLFGEA